MKIVINTCFGGFGLSPKAVMELIKMGSPLIDKYKETMPATTTKKIGKTGYSTNTFGHVYKDEFVYYARISSENRNHPDLVAVVEKLKSKADGYAAKLKVVEIPDDVKWEIDYYDGKESIEECHRSWS